MKIVTGAVQPIIAGAFDTLCHITCKTKPCNNIHKETAKMIGSAPILLSSECNDGCSKTATPRP